MRALTILTVLYVAMAGCGNARAGAAATEPGHTEKSALIYVARRGWHIDVGLSAAELGPDLAPVAAGLPGARYVFFGFGDRHYLLSRHRSAPSTLAALWPGAGMMLVTVLGASPSDAFGSANVIALRVTQAELVEAVGFIAASMAQPVQPYGSGPYPGGMYFASTARYSALHTCNTWAAQMLAAAGLPIHSRGVVFAGQLWRQLRRLTSPDQLHGGLVPS